MQVDAGGVSMERLTKRVDGIAVLESWAVGKDPVSVIQRLCSALAAHEDTGLDPGDLKKAFNEAAILKLAAQALGTTPDHLRDLIQAENDGRLVVLPCGNDAELTRNGYTFSADHWNHFLTAFRDAPENKSGKQIELFSISEVEAALAEKGGEA